MVKYMVPQSMIRKTPQVFVGKALAQIAYWFWIYLEKTQILRDLYLSEEKEMATYSSVLAWRIPGTVEPGGLQSMGLLRSDTTKWLHFHALEKEMATHSSVLAWRIPGMGKPGGLLSMGSHRAGHDWSDLA